MIRTGPPRRILSLSPISAARRPEWSMLRRCYFFPARLTTVHPPISPSFASTEERATAAHKQFQEIVSKYPHTRSGEIARYFLGLTSLQLGDYAAAGRELKSIADSHNEDFASLAKFALASVYRNTNRNKDAIELYKKLADKPTRTVGKVTAQLELAETYQASQQPLEAKRIYEQIQKENPSSDAAQVASAKLQELNSPR